MLVERGLELLRLVRLVLVHRPLDHLLGDLPLLDLVVLFSWPRILECYVQAEFLLSELQEAPDWLLIQRVIRDLDSLPRLV